MSVTFRQRLIVSDKFYDVTASSLPFFLVVRVCNGFSRGHGCTTNTNYRYKNPDIGAGEIKTAGLPWWLTVSSNSNSWGDTAPLGLCTHTVHTHSSKSTHTEIINKN